MKESMRKIEKAQAIQLAVDYGKRKGFAPFTAEDALFEEDKWQVMLDFDDAPLGHPGFIVVEIDPESGIATSTKGL